MNYNNFILFRLYSKQSSQDIEGIVKDLLKRIKKKDKIRYERQYIGFIG